uniref:Uncharacterized protein n=1 Tax=Anopheles arabiensis TaxID=7173 RepID=A0A182IGE0_ANOAR
MTRCCDESASAPRERTVVCRTIAAGYCILNTKRGWNVLIQPGFGEYDDVVVGLRYR